MSCKLILVRHGETQWNLESRYQGAQDIPLNERGVAGAKELAKDLAPLSLHAIYSSPLSRAQQTAKIIANSRALKIELREGLRELGFGRLEGKTGKEIQELCSLELAYATKLPSTERMNYKLVPDQESGTDVLGRVLPCLHDIAGKHIGETVLIVTHGGVIRTLLIHFAQFPWEKTHIPNCNGACFVCSGESFELKDFPLEFGEKSGTWLKNEDLC